ncbi:trans-sialidase [Trypanosoma brucei brucei TREU927]|uniref:Trans-sialidase n=1 Tax=Trypanosoma brucei brucei (strain 927/4 GUTat10.1) TaxID=185431 RepID=Q57XJ2_TRYB2|nr:trans-sialidase [Trypanosoma brucei brucei TREU927]AAX69677.1 trans-sialidase [Trypanosoma brucei]AAZ12746.1 trans-sialidase [Trypanosoma brucei brucei TREU927]
MEELHQQMRMPISRLLLIFTAVCHCCALTSKAAGKGTTREAFLSGGAWALRKKLSEKDGEVWWWQDGPNWKDKYDKEWERWFKEEKGPWGGSEKRSEWFARMTGGYITLGKTKILSSAIEGSDKVERTVHSFRIPSFVEVDGVLMGIGDARYLTSTDYFFTDTVAKYSADGGKTWKTEVIIENGRVDPTYSRVVDPTVVAKADSVFVLVARYNVTKGYWHNENNAAGIADWEPFMYKGVVTKGADGKTSDVRISWTKTPLKPLYDFTVAGSKGTQFIGGAGNGVVTLNGTILFPVQARNEDNAVVSMVMYSVDDGVSWHFARGETALLTSEASLTEWNGKLLMSARTDTSGVNVEGGFRKVFESNNLGATWEESLGTISRVIGNSPDRTKPSPTANYPGSSGALITVTLGDVPVMLITHPKNTKGAWSRDRLQLWMTDGNRMWLVGQISEGDDNSAYSSLLLARDGLLYCLHEQNIDEVYGLHLVHLVDELEKVNATVRKWKAQDALLAGLCSSSRKKNDPTCSGVPTDGLVGLLAGPVGASVWADVYDCVNASISDGVKVSEGVQLGGKRNSRVLWPVSEQGQDQRYYFANTHFTLLATVRFAGEPKAEAPLMGFSNAEGKTSETLSLTVGGKKWVLTYGSVRKEGPTTSMDWNQTHQIALTLRDGKVDAHVNGELIIKEVSVGASESSAHLHLSHFFIGAPVNDSGEGGNNVIVRNVLLYNRKLDEDELQLLYSNREKIQPVVSAVGIPEGMSAPRLCCLLILMYVLAI